MIITTVLLSLILCIVKLAFMICLYVGACAVIYWIVKNLFFKDNQF